MGSQLITGSARAPIVERKNDLYQSPPEAVRALLGVERNLPLHIWEPACGPGAIVNVLRAAGHRVYASDLVDYGCPNSHARRDFLMERALPENVGAIVTNPPFKNAGEFVAHALDLCPFVIMLLRLAFLESEKRRSILDGGMLARVHVFRKRLPMMHREGFDGPKGNNSGMAFAWFIWERGHRGPATLHRLSWEEFAPREAA
jgi:hypothetical protein